MALLVNKSVIKRTVFPLLVTSFIASFTYATTSEDYELALTAFNDAAYDEAYIHLKNSLQKDPENLSAKILMGEILLINGYLSAAEMEFVEALEMGADINLLAEPLGNTWLFLNKYQSIVDFSDTNKLSGDALREWLLIRATACIRLERLECALRDYNTIIARSPNFVRAINGLASIALQREELVNAENLIGQAMAVEPENAITWRLKGQLAYRKGNRQEATEHLQKALNFNRDDPIALRNLVDLYLEVKDYDSAKLFVEEIIEDTPNDPLAILLNSWLKSRDNHQAIANDKLKELNEFMAQLDPELITSQPMLLYISGLTNFFNSNLEQATKDFSTYLQKEPEDLQAVLMLSQVYMATQQDKQALILLERYQNELMEKIDAALLLGDLFIRQGQAFKADRLLRNLVEKYPEEGKLQLFKIKLMAARGQQDEALRILDLNFPSYQDNAGFLFTYALMQLQAGNFEEAFQGAERLSALFPEEAEIYNLRAGILIRQEKLEEAKRNIEKALLLNPTLFPAKFNLAATESRLGNINTSNTLISELLALSPQHSETLMLRAFNHTKEGELEQAKQIYLDLLTLSPSNSGAREKLSMLYQQMGDTSAALYHLDLLLKDNFDNPNYLLRKAALQIREKHNVEAEKTLNIARNFINSEPNRLVTFANLAHAIKSDDAAKNALARAMSLAPDNTSIALQYTSFLLDINDNEEADKILKSLSASRSKSPIYHFLQGRLQANRGNSEQAVNAYQKALDIDPTFVQALSAMYNYALVEQHVDIFLSTARRLASDESGAVLAKHLLAQYLFFIREFEESSTLYLELIEEGTVLNPAEVYNRLAIMSLENTVTDAKQYIIQAYELQPNSAKILDTFGYIKALEGDYEGSLRMLRDAFARDAKDPNIRYHLGYTLAKLNRIDEAKKELTFAVNVERPFFMRPQAKRLLDSL
ncbi:lipoprotein [Alteromonas sp. KUL42]|nr:PEP-CTERM system TPR-repeat protein PrsT [Alteromonas sp. KUL42]GEA05805.1 lipoprotein [Alteromonas sp. KUL42]